MRSEPSIVVECEQCSATIEIGLTTTARGYDERNVNADIKRQEWITEEDEFDFCSEECRQIYHEKFR